jgi:poly-gamma-glutamate capsule biosynthesis protein CapA/YwtB (metallophosphatase superfamily)
MMNRITRRDLFAGAVALASAKSARSADGGVSRGGNPDAAARVPVPDQTAKSISLIAVGDITLGYHLEEYMDDQVKRGATMASMLAYPFERVRSIFAQADLVVANLECPFTLRGEKLVKNFNFRARPELVGALQAGGIHLVTIANNHLKDYGSDGVVDTIATLDQAGIAHCGAGRTLAEARMPAIVKRGGTSLGFLGYFFLGDRNIEPPEIIAATGRPGVAGTYKDLPGMERMLAEDLGALRGKVDLPVVFWHWGREGSSELEDYQVRLGHLCVEQGARLVLGSHPHVLQGMELYQGVPIIYSLANFVFGGNANPKNKDSAMYRAQLNRSGVIASEVIPVQTTRVPEAPFQPMPADGERAKEIMEFLAHAPLAGGKTLPAVAERPAP